MRLISFVVLVAALVGCGGHLPAIRRTLAQNGTPCEEIALVRDGSDGWLLPVQGCNQEWQCWVKTESGKMFCGPQKPIELQRSIAREYLRCPDGKLEEEAAPERHTAITGCDRLAWCTEMHGDVVSCGAPEGLQYAAKQLSVETGCPAESIEQQQFFGVSTQHTYRLNACGNQFSCVVPLVGDGRAGSRFGSQLTCKPVPAASTSAQ